MIGSLFYLNSLNEVHADSVVTYNVQGQQTDNSNSISNKAVVLSSSNKRTKANSNTSSDIAADQTKYSDLSFWTDKSVDKEGNVYLNAITVPSDWTIEVPKTGENDISDPEPDKFYAFANIKKDSDTYFVLSRDLINGQTYISVYNGERIEQNVNAIDSRKDLLALAYKRIKSNHSLSMSNSDGGWQTSLQMMGYKASLYGHMFVVVKFKNITQMCPS